jgi:hypothetical protein
MNNQGCQIQKNRPEQTSIDGQIHKTGNRSTTKYRKTGLQIQNQRTKFKITKE